MTGSCPRTNESASENRIGREYPTRVPISFKGQQGYIVLDQIRTVDQVRLVRRLGTIDSDTDVKVLAVLRQMFEP